MPVQSFSLLNAVRYILVLIVISSCQQAAKKEDNTDAFSKVVVIVADDHSFTSAGFFGNQYIETPNMDRLADQA
ncbi:MAG: hypothetical protein JXQ96_22835 [Cyclobacteriaceae bacterium]